MRRKPVLQIFDKLDSSLYRDDPIEHDAIEGLSRDRFLGGGGAQDVDDLDVVALDERMNIGGANVVFGDEEQLFLTQLHRLLDLVERFLERFFCERFLQATGGAECESAPVVLMTRHDVYRNVSDHGVVLQAVEQRPAAHVGEADVESNRARVELAREIHGGAAAQGDQCLQAAIMRHLDQDAREGGVVFDDQQHAIAVRNEVAVVVDDEVFDRDRSSGRQDEINFGDGVSLGGLADGRGVERFKFRSGRNVDLRQIQREGAAATESALK